MVDVKIDILFAVSVASELPHGSLILKILLNHPLTRSRIRASSQSKQQQVKRKILKSKLGI